MLDFVPGRSRLKSYGANRLLETAKPGPNLTQLPSHIPSRRPLLSLVQTGEIAALAGPTYNANHPIPSNHILEKYKKQSPSGEAMATPTIESSVEEFERQTFEESDSVEMPPSDLFAFNELRSCADLFRMYRGGQPGDSTRVSERDCMAKPGTNKVYRFPGEAASYSEYLFQPGLQDAKMASYRRTAKDVEHNQISARR